MAAMAPDALSDDEILAVLSEERRRSVGFEHNDALTSERERALNYYRGQMPDVPTLPGRSRAASTDVAEAVETILPDLVEIFTGGEDVASFTPAAPQDEAAARQETDYVNHVVFNENPGFLILYTLFKDALLSKTGLVKFWWEDPGAEARAPPWGDEDGDLGLAILAEAGQMAGRGRSGVKIQAVPPEDFTIAADAISLASAHYCAMRSRPRAQALIAEGYDPVLVEQMPAYGSGGDGLVARARDAAGEHNLAPPGGQGDLRCVEVVEHYIRLDADGCGRPCLWKVVTGAGETLVLDRTRVERAPFAAITPYLTPHRFYGRSVADVLMEVQRIKTALTRMALDSGYFALNQRQEVALERANAFTISDLLRNEPGVPVRSRTGDAVRPIAAGGLGFDAFSALEYFSTVGEQRSGIVRNAQGLNPDTLHDTAEGAMAMMSAAQKRVRLIARIFAETGIKDLFLGVHDLVRRHAAGGAPVRLKGCWTQVDPSAWPERCDMTVEVGLGASGRAHDLMVARELWALQSQIVQSQGGAHGPFVTQSNVYNLLKRIGERAGLKSTEAYFSDPGAQSPPPSAGPPPPSPDALKAQMEMTLKREQMQAELALKRDQLAAELQLKREEIEAERRLRLTQAKAAPDQASLTPVHMGGAPG